MEIKDRLRSLREEKGLTLDMLVYDMNNKFDIDISKDSLRYTDKDGNVRYADGLYSPSRNKIYVNPEGSRSLSRVLIHELTHAIYKTSEGKLLLEEGARNLSEEEKNRIVAKYFADDLVITKENVLEYADELNAHYIEALLDDERLLEKLRKKYMKMFIN